jgi:hypothetical protein
MQYRLERKLHLDNISYKERIFDNESIINFMKIREKIEKAVRKIEKMIKNE